MDRERKFGPINRTILRLEAGQQDACSIHDTFNNFDFIIKTFH